MIIIPYLDVRNINLMNTFKCNFKLSTLYMNRHDKINENKQICNCLTSYYQNLIWTMKYRLWKQLSI